jgi:hypothetical protein
VRAVLVVRVAEAAQDVDDDGQRGVERHLDPGRRARVMNLAEALAVDVLHGEVRGAVLFPDVVDVHDVGIAQGRGEPGLVEKLGHERGIARELRDQTLDQHQLLEPGRRPRSRQVQLGHPACGQQADQLVPPHRGAGSGRVGREALGQLRHRWV